MADSLIPSEIFSKKSLLLVILLGFSIWIPSAPAQTAAAWQPSAASTLLDIALEVTAREHERNGPRPTVGSRMLAILVTAMHDAWAPFDPRAVGTRPDGPPRRPPDCRTEAGKIAAMTQALSVSLHFLFPEDAAFIDGKLEGFRKKFNVPGPGDEASKVGALAAEALIRFRRMDGSNQTGGEAGSRGKPYSDYTFYEPRNSVDKVVDPDRWQPIPFDDGKGGTVVLGFLTPHWYRVRPFGLERPDMFRPGPPPKVGSDALRREVEEVISLNANLTPDQKAVVEFMRDGPRSTGQSGHWLRFAQAVSARDKNSLDRDVILFFAVGNTALDAFIAAWEAKRYYDSSRPWTLVRHCKKGQKVECWAGPGKGVLLRDAGDWLPYSPATFITPPFPGYVSGHSCVSAACARTLELFTGSDTFGAVENRHAGELTEPGFTCEVMQARNGKFTGSKDLSCDVVLRLPTFSETAKMAGISRVLGGYHIQSDNTAGLEMGRKVADHLWPKFMALRGDEKPASSQPR